MDTRKELFAKVVALGIAAPLALLVQIWLLGIALRPFGVTASRLERYAMIHVVSHWVAPVTVRKFEDLVEEWKAADQDAGPEEQNDDD